MFGKIRKNRSLTAGDKLRLIECYESGLNAKQLQTEFQCGKTQVYETLKRRHEIQRNCSDTTRIIKGRELNQVVNGVVWDWVLEAKSREIPITAAKLKERARSVAEKLGNVDFRATNAWLYNFRNTHNMVWSGINNNTREMDDDQVLLVEDMEILPNTPLSIEVENLDSAPSNDNIQNMTPIIVAGSIQNGGTQQTTASIQVQEDDRLERYFGAHFQSDAKSRELESECSASWESPLVSVCKRKSSEDLAHEHFIRFVDNSLKSISGAYRVDMARLEIQQVLIKYKHSTDLPKTTTTLDGREEVEKISFLS